MMGLLPVKVACREGQCFPMTSRFARLPGAQALPLAERLVLHVLRHWPVHLGVRAVAHALKRRGPKVLQSMRARTLASH